MRGIYITEFDAKRLREAIREAQAGDYRGSQYIVNLKGELSRANIVDPQDIPPNVITMNSTVELLDVEAEDEMTLTLVFPPDSDPRQGKISVLAPIGTAILGYREGDTIEWSVPDGQRHLKVVRILYQPEASGDFDV